MTGCGSEAEPVQFTEVKLVHEKLKPEEIETFLRIINSLSDKKLPKFPAVFPDPPDWSAARTLSVSELVAEDEKLLEERTRFEWLASRLTPDRRLDRALRREQMSRQQFVGLTLTIGLALTRTAVAGDRDLKRLIERGEKELKLLRRDERPFFELSIDDLYAVRRKAVWLARLDRAERLDQVPPENVALVEENRDKLAAVLPHEFLTDPIAPIADRLEEQGLPFEELTETGSDEYIAFEAKGAPTGTASQ